MTNFLDYSMSNQFRGVPFMSLPLIFPEIRESWLNDISNEKAKCCIVRHHIDFVLGECYSKVLLNQRIRICAESSFYSMLFPMVKVSLLHQLFWLF